ncbi:hypothetical protein V8B97DRAFT_680326 [Scleroderma yunnanense]
MSQLVHLLPSWVQFDLATCASSVHVHEVSVMAPTITLRSVIIFPVPNGEGLRRAWFLTNGPNLIICGGYFYTCHSSPMVLG